MNKIKKLFSTLPPHVQNNNPLYLLAQDILSLEPSKGFILSTKDPEDRYNIAVNKAYLNMKNDYIVDFENLGPNEKYLINFIMFNKRNLLYLIGGIGVGKTSFCYFLKDILQKSFQLHNPTANEEPLVFLFDLFEERSLFVNLKSPDEFKNAFINYFSNKIIGEIQRRQCFSVDMEVLEIWESILDTNKKNIISSSVIDLIRTQLHKNNVSKVKGSVMNSDENKEILLKRKQIRNNILEDERFSLSYIAILLNYVKNYYQLRRNIDIFIIIDNIDPEPPELIRQMNDALRRFASISGIKTLICARQTTWNQTISYDCQDIPSQVAYTGPDPIQILESKLLSFEKQSSMKEHYDEKSFKDIYSRIIELWRLSFANDRFCTHFKAFCGNSIRKSLLLGQNLICNSLYDLAKIEKKEKVINNKIFQLIDLKMGDLCRAVVVGRTGTYEWRHDDFVENIFQVYENLRDSRPLMKLRLLKAIKNYDAIRGITLNNLFFIMKEGFQYDHSTTVDALNELKHKEKRLIWSDTVRYKFENDLLEKHGRSFLYLSSAGRGYEDILFKSMNYIEEVMMDTYANIDRLGTNWNYNNLEDRFNLLYWFLDLLAETDVKEVKTFIGNLGIEEYEAAFGETNLITINMFKSVRDVLFSVLRYRSGNEKYQDEHLDKYDAKITLLENTDRLLFKKNI